MRKYYLFIVFLGLFIAVLVITGFIVGGTPVSLQAIAADSTRINDFNYIKNSINTYYNINGGLPTNLSLLPSGTPIIDQQTQKNYVYTKVSSDAYTLCADFAASSDDIAKVSPMYYNSYGDEEKHVKGYDCIEYTVDKTYTID